MEFNKNPQLCNAIRVDTAMNATPPSDPLPPRESVGLKHSEVETALGSLSLTWVSVGDYLVVMSGEVDAEICSEPYLALQLWLNMRSGKFIARVWNQGFNSIAQIWA